MSFPHASRPSSKSNKTGIKKFPRVKRDNQNNNLLYKLYLEKRLTDLGQLYIASHLTCEVVQEEMDDYMDKLCDVIHSAAEDAGCTNQQKYTHKPYWCPRLSELRDKKRFWWRLWVLNNRPRIGQVYECYKGVKKLFRKSFRQSVSNITDNHFQKLQNMYNKRNMRAFWNEIRNSKQAKVVSSVQPETFKDFHSGIMQESGHTTNIDEQILCDVDSFYVKHSSYHNAHDVSRETLHDLIDSMRHNASPGIDGLSAEHLQYGKCDTLCSILASVYSTILSHCYVPTSFTHGVIVPVLKKSTLNPNLSENYRPITISCMLSKILELLVIPNTNISNTQFGFRKKMGTAFGCNLLSDVLSYFKYQNSPVYLCSLDAEKCFDNICDKLLFFKLIDVIPSKHWMLCYRWYSRLCATVKWQGSYSSMFLVTKGTRQGSILSPYFFNIFINDLLLSLKNMNEGVAIGNLKLNSFAYADDVNLFCSSASGLQSLIDVCHNYSITWRFKFGIRKTKCMIYGNNLHPSPPKWRMGSDVIAIDNKLDILGTTFTKDGQCTEHVENRIRKCRQSFYSLSNSGMAFPGATVDVKRYLWNSICTPVLTYGLDGININVTNMKKLETTQGNLIKQCLGISKSTCSYIWSGWH